MNFSLSSLLAGFIFGVIGVYLIKYAKDKGNIPQILIGIGLLLYPYFISNAYLVWALGFALLAMARYFK